MRKVRSCWHFWKARCLLEWRACSDMGYLEDSLRVGLNVLPDMIEVAHGRRGESVSNGRRSMFIREPTFGFRALQKGFLFCLRP